MGREGFEPPKREAADLQSASFNRTWIPTQNKGKSGPGRTRTCDILFVGEASWPLNDGTNAERGWEVEQEVYEPSTSWLQARRSSNWSYCPRDKRGVRESNP